MRHWPVPDDRINRGLYWSDTWRLVEGCTPASHGCDRCWSASETHMRAAQQNPKVNYLVRKGEVVH